MFRFLAAQMVSAIAVSLHFDNLPTSISYLILTWLVPLSTALPVEHTANGKVRVFLGNSLIPSALL